MPHWTKFSYHEGHSMGSAPRRTDSWLKSDLNENQGPALLPQRSTLNTNKPASMPRGRGAYGNFASNSSITRSSQLMTSTRGNFRSQAQSPDSQVTPGPGAYQVNVPSTLRSTKNNGVSFKGGSLKGPTRMCILDSNMNNYISTNGAIENQQNPGAGVQYQKITTGFNFKGGSIAKAGRKIDWMYPKDGTDYNTNGRKSGSATSLNTGSMSKLYMPKSTLASNQTALIGATPRFRESTKMEVNASQTPGPGHYKTTVEAARSSNGKGITFKRGSKRDPVALGKSAYSWYHASDTPGPAAYEPLSHAEHRKKRIQESYMNQISKLSVSARGSRGLGPDGGPGSSIPSTARKSYEFTPRVRGSA